MENNEVITVTGKKILLSPAEKCRLTYLNNQVRTIGGYDYRARLGIAVYDRNNNGNIEFMFWLQMTYLRPSYLHVDYWEAHKKDPNVKEKDYTIPETRVKVGNRNQIAGEYEGLHTMFNLLITHLRSKECLGINNLIDVHLFLNYYAEKILFVRDSYNKEIKDIFNPFEAWMRVDHAYYLMDKFQRKFSDELNSHPDEARKWEEYKEPTIEDMSKTKTAYVKYGATNKEYYYEQQY